MTLIIIETPRQTSLTSDDEDILYTSRIVNVVVRAAWPRTGDGPGVESGQFHGSDLRNWQHEGAGRALQACDAHPVSEYQIARDLETTPRGEFAIAAGRRVRRTPAR